VRKKDDGELYRWVVEQTGADLCVSNGEYNNQIEKPTISMQPLNKQRLRRLLAIQHPDQGKDVQDGVQRERRDV